MAMIRSVIAVAGGVEGKEGDQQGGLTYKNLSQRENQLMILCVDPNTKHLIDQFHWMKKIPASLASNEK